MRKWVDVRLVGGAGGEPSSVCRAVEEAMTGADVWVEGRGVEAERNLLIDRRRTRMELSRTEEVACRPIQCCVDTYRSSPISPTSRGVEGK